MAREAPATPRSSQTAAGEMAGAECRVRVGSDVSITLGSVRQKSTVRAARARWSTIVGDGGRRGQNLGVVDHDIKGMLNQQVVDDLP